MGRVAHGTGGEVEFLSQFQLEEETSTTFCHLLSILIQEYIDIGHGVRKIVEERKVDPVNSSDAAHKLATVVIHTALWTRLPEGQEFVVCDDGVCCRKYVSGTAKICIWRI